MKGDPDEWIVIVIVVGFLFIGAMCALSGQLVSW